MKRQMICTLLIICLLFSAQQLVVSGETIQDEVNSNSADGVWITAVSSLAGSEIATFNNLSRESPELAGLKAGNAETDIGMVIAVIVVIVILAGLYKAGAAEKTYDAIHK